jgi:hypothetical protein
MENVRATLLTAPQAELEALSFALPEPKSVGEWISRLPMANVSESAGQIRQATFEIARLDTDWGTRMDLLEGIRPTVLYLAARLDKTANGAGSQADAISRLAQRLQTNLCSGYRAVVLAALETAAENAEACTTLSLAAHRALSDLSRTLLRTLQYYVAPAERLWLKLNQLYHLAEQLGIDREVHADTESNTTLQISISGIYLRSLLLAMARPYQLRHRQLTDVFRALGAWAPVVSLSDAPGEGVHVIDLASDHGPVYTEAFAGGGTKRAVRAEALIEALEAHLRNEDADIVIPAHIDNALISHLTGAWGEMKPRAFRRSATSDPVKVTVGLRSTHYFLSGGTAFADLLGPGSSATPGEINPFLKDDVRFVPNISDRPRDVWDDAFDVGAKIPVNPSFDDPEQVLYPHEPKKRSAETEDDYRCHDTTSADMSPGGYRLRWNEPFPTSLQTGELIGLRDETDPRWCLAVARWIRQDEAGPFMGVELLAPQAKPVAVRLVQSRGGRAEYKRAFLLPELKPVGRPATLITPEGPFATGQKIHLWDDGTQNTAQLGDCLLKTESFNQFTFRMLGGYLEKSRSQTNMVNRKQINKTQTGFR